MRAFSFNLHNRSGPSLVLGWEANNINDFSRAKETLSNCGNGLQNNAFKSLINIHGIKGAAEWSSFCDNQLGRVSGITEHLQSYASSGQNVITTSTSKRGRPAGPSKSRKRWMPLVFQCNFCDGFSDY